MQPVIPVMVPVAVHPPAPMQLVLPAQMPIFVPADGVVELIGYEPDVSAQLLSYGHQGFTYEVLECGNVQSTSPHASGDGPLATAPMLRFKIHLSRVDSMRPRLSPSGPANPVATMITGVGGARASQTPRLSRSARRALGREAREAREARKAHEAHETHKVQEALSVVSLGEVQTRRRGSSSASAASAAATVVGADDFQSIDRETSRTLLSLSQDTRSVTPSMLEEEEKEDIRYVGGEDYGVEDLSFKRILLTRKDV